MAWDDPYYSVIMINTRGLANFQTFASKKAAENFVASHKRKGWKLHKITLEDPFKKLKPKSKTTKGKSIRITPKTPKIPRR